MQNINLKHAKILVIDDQVANTDVLSDLLELEEYVNVKAINDSRQALDIVKDWKPDLVLLDLMMPFYNGFDIMKMIKENLLENEFLPILVLTADISNETKRKALSEGATDFLFKPFELVEVSLRISNLLQSRYMFLQLQKQNKQLDIKVNERTVQLEKANKELNEAYERIQASDQFKTIFISNISHELRTPLNGIFGFAQILAENDFSKEEKAVYLNKIYESSDRLLKTITNYIDISNLVAMTQRVTRKDFFPDFIVQNVIEEYSDLIQEKNILLEADIPVNCRCYLSTDANILTKVVGHLVDNAVKFSHKGKINIGFRFEEGNFIFYVKDEGIGISKENQERIFEAFVQEDSGSTRSYEGNGLGLAISQKFVELLGGKIWIESEKNVGTTVFFSLPGISNEMLKKRKGT